MPELPEVETVVRGLRASVLERRIVGVRIGKSDFIDDPGALAEHLPGAQITAVERFGKFIAISLGLAPRERASGGGADNAVRTKGFLIVHLGMTGQLIPRAGADSVAAHTHVFFELDDGREIRYTDVRRFGRIAYVPESQIGQFQGKTWRRSARGHRKRIRRAISIARRACEGIAARSIRASRHGEYLCGRISLSSAHSSGANRGQFESGTVASASHGDAKCSRPPRFACAVLRFRIFWILKASREATNYAIEYTAARESHVLVAELRFAEQSSRDAAVTFARNANHLRVLAKNGNPKFANARDTSDGLTCCIMPLASWRIS